MKLIGVLTCLRPLLSLVACGARSEWAAYQEGTNPQTSDEMLVIATDIGENRGRLITTRIAGS